MHRLFNKITPIISVFLSVIMKKIKPAKYQESCSNDLCKYISLKSKALLIAGFGEGIEVPIFIFKAVYTDMKMQTNLINIRIAY